MLAGCCIVAIFGVTALYGSTFGLMMLPMQKELGWSRADIAFSLTLMTLGRGYGAAAGGWLVDHVRLRPLVVLGIVLRAASLAAFALMGASVWVYYGLCVAMVFTARGASLLTLAKLVQAWFDKAWAVRWASCSPASRSARCSTR